MKYFNIKIILIQFFFLIFLQFSFAEESDKNILNTVEKKYITNNPEVSIAVINDHIPFSFLDDGKVTGFSADLINLISQKTGLKITLIPDHWYKNIAKFKNEKIKLIDAISYKKERTEFTLFTKPYYEIPFLIYANSSVGAYEDLSSLKGKRVGILKDFVLEKQLRDLKLFQIVEFGTAKEGMKNLAYEKIDAFITNLQQGNLNIKNNAYTNIVILSELNLDNSINDLRIGVNKSNPVLFSIISKGLEAVTSNEILSLQNKWFGVPLFNGKKKEAELKLTNGEQNYLNNRDSIKMCVDPDWMPYEHINKLGEHEGIAADYISLFEERIGKKIELLPTKTWSESIEFAKKRKCDILSAAGETSTRKKYLNFTTEYLLSPNVIVTRNNVKYIENINYVLDKKFTVAKGSAISEELKKFYPDMKLIPVDSISDGLDQVVSGKVFGYIDALPPIGYQMQKQSIFTLKIAGNVDVYSNSKIAIRNDDPILFGIFQKAVNSITNEDKLRIRNKWLSVKYEQGFNYSLFWKIIIGVVLLLLIVICWNRRLLIEIKKRRKAEEALQTSYRELGNEREQLYVTIRSLGEGVITTDTFGKILIMNKAAEDLTACSFKDVKGTLLTEVYNIFNIETGDSLENPVLRVLESGEKTDSFRHKKLISKNGEECQIADSSAPIKSVNGDIIGVVLVFRDVTNEYKMREKILKAEKLKSVGFLAGGIAHDFNNILTGIYGYISLAKMKISKEEPGFEYLVKAEESLNRAVALTKQLLTFSKGGDPVKENADLEVLIEEVVSFDLSGSNVKFLFKKSSDLWITKVDKGQMQQVFSNLTINANKAMPDGGKLFINMDNIEVLKDAVPGLENGKYVKITVRDEGIGIDKINLDKLFDPYFTTRQDGTGLGLATVYSIITKHNGIISIDSELGLGTTVTIYLPASKLLNPEKPAGIEKNSERSLKILVMDDEEMIRMVSFEMLKHLGYFAEFAKEGKQAIEMYETAVNSDEPFDVVILDLTIPGGLGGEEAVKGILEIDPEAKVVVSSGYAVDPVMSNYKEYGFKGIMPKPFSIDNMKKVLSEVLGE